MGFNSGFKGLMLHYFGKWLRIEWYIETDVSEKPSSSIFRIENCFTLKIKDSEARLL